MADPVAALVNILKGDAAVVTIADDRVFGGELPDAETQHMPRTAIVLRASGGASLTSGSYVEHDTVRVDVFAYGPTAKAAADLCAIAALTLRRVQRRVVAGTLIHWISPAGGYSSAREPMTDWPRAFQSFQVFHALGSIS